LKEEKGLHSHKEWLKKFPAAAITKFGWLPKEDSPVRKLKVLLNFFGVAGVEEWIALWQSPQAAYRSSVSFQKNPYAVAAWLRQGEIEAKNRYKPYNLGLFRNRWIISVHPHNRASEMLEQRI
jgi:hypothetical protein